MSLISNSVAFTVGEEKGKEKPLVSFFNLTSSGLVIGVVQLVTI